MKATKKKGKAGTLPNELRKMRSGMRADEMAEEELPEEELTDSPEEELFEELAEGEELNFGEDELDDEEWDDEPTDEELELEELLEEFTSGGSVSLYLRMSKKALNARYTREELKEHMRAYKERGETGPFVPDQPFLVVDPEVDTQVVHRMLRAETRAEVKANKMRGRKARGKLAKGDTGKDEGYRYMLMLTAHAVERVGGDFTLYRIPLTPGKAEQVVQRWDNLPLKSRIQFIKGLQYSDAQAVMEAVSGSTHATEDERGN